MKLIVTGHDYSGKSTILDKIFREDSTGKMSYIHLSYREPTTFEFYKNTLEFSNFVMDRCFLDEAIYPEVFKRPMGLSFNELAVLLEIVENKDITLIIFECSDEEIKNRISKRTDIEEEPEVLEQIFNIKRKYRFFANYFNLPIIDTTGKSLEEIESEVNNIVDKNKIRRK